MPERDLHGRRLGWLIFVCAVSALGGFLFGLDAIIISGTIGPVRTQFALGSTAEGLFVSASLIGCAFGAALAGPIADRFGRRTSLVAAGLVTLVGVAACSFAATPVMLVLTRFVGGLGVGMASMTCPLYIAEIAPQRLRGRLVSLYQFAITLGILAALLLNALIAASTGEGGGLVSAAIELMGGDAWRVMFATQVPAALAFTLLALAIPESPRWLLRQGEPVRASTILRSFIGVEEAEEALRQRDDDAAPRLAALFSPQHRRPTLIAVVLAIFSELSGITVIFYYGPLLLAAAGAGETGALSGFAILGVVNMAATLIALWLIDHAGRRRLLLIGSIGCAGCMMLLALLLQQETRSVVPLIAAICLFIGFYAFSLGPIKFVVAAEIFPRALRGLGTALGTTTVWTTGAVINQLFPIVRDGLGPHIVFYGCTAALLAHFVFVWRFVPETAGRSLEEIETLWSPSKKRDMSGEVAV